MRTCGRGADALGRQDRTGSGAPRVRRGAPERGDGDSAASTRAGAAPGGRDRRLPARAHVERARLPVACRPDAAGARRGADPPANARRPASRNDRSPPRSCARQRGLARASPSAALHRDERGLGRAACRRAASPRPCPACVSEIHERPSVKPQNVSDAHARPSGRRARSARRSRACALEVRGARRQPAAPTSASVIATSRPSAREALHVRDEVAGQARRGWRASGSRRRRSARRRALRSRDDLVQAVGLRVDPLGADLVEVELGVGVGRRARCETRPR